MTTLTHTKKISLIVLGILPILIIMVAVFAIYKKPINNSSSLKIVAQQYDEKTPSKIIQQDDLTIKNYTSELPNYPNQIILNAQDQVEMVREIVTPEIVSYPKDYITNTNVQPIIKYTKTGGDHQPLLIYENLGIALLTKEKDSRVLEVWRFTPANIQEIMQSWGGNLIFDLEEVSGH